MAIKHLGIEFVFIVAKPIELSFDELAAYMNKFLLEKVALKVNKFIFSNGCMEWEITDPVAKANLITLVWLATERELKFSLNIYIKPEYEAQPPAKFKGENWHLDLAQELFLRLKARLAVGGSSGVGEDLDLSTSETLGLGGFQGTILIDKPRWELLQEFCDHVHQRPPWSEHLLDEERHSLVWPGWFGEPENTSLEPIIRLPWEIDAPSFDNSVTAQYDFLSIAGFGSLTRLTETIAHTYHFLEEAKDLDVSLDLMPEGLSLRLYAAAVLNFIRINRSLVNFEPDVLDAFERLLSLPLDEIILTHNFLKMSIFWANVAYLKCPFGKFQIYWNRLHENKDAKALLFFPLGEDKFDYLGEGWQLKIIEHFFKACDLEWCAGSVGLTVYLKSESIVDDSQMKDYPLIIRRLENNQLDFHVDEGYFENITDGDN